MTKKSASPTAGDPVSRFEASLKELDTIVARMERGDLPLEESLQLFERGTALTRECREALATAELRVRNLLETQELPRTETPVPAPEAED